MYEGSAPEIAPATRILAVVRLALIALVAAAIAATFIETSSRETVNPLNFFGYFTMQGNILMVFALLEAALRSLAGREPTRGWTLLRACAVSYMAVIGVVYNTLLIGQAGGATVPWANTVLHVIFPLYAVLDWVLCADRTVIAWRRLWVALIYPAVWTAVVLARGATDGWVPYPFLDPANGYGTVALYCVGIMIVFILAALGSFAATRIPSLRTLRR